MKRQGFSYDVLTRLEYTKEDLDFLTRLSQGHYDSHCRNQSACGGILYGMGVRLQFQSEEVATESLSLRDLDTFCKILEVGEILRLENPLLEVLPRLFAEAREEYRRINGLQDT